MSGKACKRCIMDNVAGEWRYCGAERREAQKKMRRRWGSASG
ncbi:hypothetical protein HMPREF0201_01987 [Cedecea davisae DSM 4568]|uniref:Uncharacterized protein n=1 Tax=Cedecea davisae DSM 4568 TaxID=566551 RepID=S3IXJ2_9ENTR|nr:hypothetical protein HMPREF0201_01987 [Cedecea davisae DSM 4568]